MNWPTPETPMSKLRKLASPQVIEALATIALAFFEGRMVKEHVADKKKRAKRKKVAGPKGKKARPKKLRTMRKLTRCGAHEPTTLYRCTLLRGHVSRHIDANDRTWPQKKKAKK